MTYAEATMKLQGRNKDSRKLENHTYLIRRGDDIAIRLHSTDVLTIHPDESVTLNSGGWHTVTTKARINEYLEHGTVWSEKGEWLWAASSPWRNPEQTKYRFTDGMTIHADGTVTGAEVWTDNRKLMKLKRDVSKYVAGFMAALESGKVPQPSGGDCWYCSMRPANVETVQIGEHSCKSASGFNGTGKQTLGEVFGDTSHIIMHMQERYYVPSLLVRAMERFGASQAAKWYMYGCMSGDSQYKRAGEVCKDQVQRTLRRYILAQLGMQA